MTDSSSAISASARMNTTGSLSTYATRAAAPPAEATSWVLGLVGRPVPTSRYCRIPAPRKNRTARSRNRRFPRALSRICGITDSDISAASRSAAKLSLPPSR